MVKCLLHHRNIYKWCKSKHLYIFMCIKMCSDHVHDSHAHGLKGESRNQGLGRTTASSRVTLRDDPQETQPTTPWWCWIFRSRAFALLHIFQHHRVRVRAGGIGGCLPPHCPQRWVGQRGRAEALPDRHTAQAVWHSKSAIRVCWVW